MKTVTGGVCAAKGFKAAGIHCGIRKNQSKKDLALIFSQVPASAAAVYTTNLVKGAPLTVTKENISDGKAQAMICNSGNANTCNADGIEKAQAMCAMTAQALGIKAEDVIVASTGVIGQTLDITPIETGMAQLVSELSEDGSGNAAQAIMTTDTQPKELAVEFELGGKTCHIGGIAKGSGMIHPNMATMLVFITTDAAISPEMLSVALKGDIQNTFNMVSVDGDTSTNDTCLVLANGASASSEIMEGSAEEGEFKEALSYVLMTLACMITKDGEGAGRFIEVKVEGAASKEDAKKLARSVVSSNLVKAAFFGSDANWGRIFPAPNWAYATSP